VATGIVTLLGGLAVPFLRAYRVEAHLLGAGRNFKGEFLRARSGATSRGVQTAIRFERGPDGLDYFRLYRDGNHNGVTTADINAGLDLPLGPAHRLDGRAPRVRVGINAGVPAIPPESGLLDPADPIRFGPSNMLSFSPLGTATPGTFYLAGEGIQAAVRVTGGSARVRMMVCRDRQWEER
jgi:hypothetical protein